MTTTTKEGSTECCMCGDRGLSFELFRCKVCEFRSQHRYCSNLYPKAESYRVCNWCLSQKEDAGEKAQNSSNSSSSCRNKSGEDDDVMRNKKTTDHGGRLKVKRGTLKIQLINTPIKKQFKSPEQSPSPSPSPSPSSLASRKRVITGGGGGDRLILRSKSEEISNGGNGITKQVFRSKVRRYKLLDEVSSQ